MSDFTLWQNREHEPIVHTGPSSIVVGALTENQAIGLGMGVAMLGGAATVVAWKAGQKPLAAIVAGITLLGAPKIATASA